ncbi:MAG: GatB/YqeY domain-containing protein, partial [Chloroflexia bacterium]|nr:GatB/YqeY domain-containing protein [Chloroflexia bacterium]
AGNREDLVDKEQRQLDIIESYLPSQMSDEDLQDFVEQGVTEAGAEGSKDMGKVMGLLSKRSDGRVDWRRLSEAVRARLAQ